VSAQTVSKWKNRGFTSDLSSRPHNIKYALSELEEGLIVSLRSTTWVPLDEIFDTLSGLNPKISRSAIYRCLVRENLNRVPKEIKEKSKKFKEYDPGFLHVDVTYLPKLDGKKTYLFVAIDRATRLMYYKVYDTKSAHSTECFLEECFEFFPFKITHILTDNGLEFSNKLHKSKRGNSCNKKSKMDIKCDENNIDHRLTKPYSPQTNGMVERANGIIKNNTILKHDYETKAEMYCDLYKFLYIYNIYRRHGSLRRELDVKTPLDALYKWYEMSPDIFKITPQDFEKKILISQNKMIN
jgi:transposase InsO family protein